MMRLRYLSRERRLYSHPLLEKGIIIFLLSFQSIQLSAQTTITINPVKDNTLYESATGTLSNGKGENLFFGRTNVGTNPDGLKRRAVLKFDVEGNVPSNATILEVSLILTVNLVPSGSPTTNVTVHALNADWGEGNSNAGNSADGDGTSAQTGDATWIHRFFNTTNWTASGGDYNSTPSATKSVGGTGSYTWMSSQLTTDVQTWLDNPSSNFGWILLGDESALKTAKRIASRENATAANRPKLTITYTIPCIDPGITSFTSSESSICEGTPSTLTVTGNLNSATAWHLYSTSCGTGAIASNATGVFEVSPSATTTYYVRGEGGCVSPGTCSNVTVEVLPEDDPTFNFNSTLYCKNDADPAPIISGDNGGTFSSSPAGLSINASTGQVDVSASVANTYSIVYSTSGDCPASSEVNLTINSVYDEVQSAAICQGESFVLGTQTLTTSGIFVETFESVAGCDSTVELTLTVHPTFEETTSATICEGDEFTFGNDVLITAGVYSKTFQTIHNCDSTVELTLNVNTTFEENISATICQGEVYQLGAQMLATPGTYSETFQSALGCDSVVVLTLAINPVYSIEESVSICEGNTFIFGSQTLTTAGIYEETFQSVQGCDSTVTLSLFIDSNEEVQVSASICDGDSFSFGSQVLMTSGNYSEIFEAISGCDSVVQLTLTVNPTYEVDFSATICSNEQYILGAQVLTVSGTYTEVLESRSGCDSTVNLTLQVNPAFSRNESATICSGENYEFGSQTLTSSGVYQETFSSVNACDSTVTLTLTVIEINTNVNKNGITLTSPAINSTYQWVDCDNGNRAVAGETSASFTPDVSGNYAVEITQQGCMEISTCTEVIILAANENTFAGRIKVYPNPTYDLIIIDMGKGFNKVSAIITNSQSQKLVEKEFYTSFQSEIDLRNFPAGIYFITIQSGTESASLKIIKH
ncbi:MAG: DNRLRE domain-containing protein [Flammeovirgaceae bacterium]|nr:DNRLRE domain-containing protein [Flammeovirgaceae bacterium]